MTATAALLTTNLYKLLIEELRKSVSQGLGQQRS